MRRVESSVLTQVSDKARESSAVLLGSLSSECVLGVHDAVAVALLGEEPLAVGCKVSVNRVTRDYGVEARGRPLRLGSQQPAESLRLLLSGAEGTGDLNGDLSGR